MRISILRKRCTILWNDWASFQTCHTLRSLWVLALVWQANHMIWNHNRKGISEIHILEMQILPCRCQGSLSRVRNKFQASSTLISRASNTLISVLSCSATWTEAQKHSLAKKQTLSCTGFFAFAGKTSRVLEVRMTWPVALVEVSTRFATKKASDYSVGSMPRCWQRLWRHLELCCRDSSISVCVKPEIKGNWGNCHFHPFPRPAKANLTNPTRHTPPTSAAVQCFQVTSQRAVSLRGSTSLFQ